METIRRKFSGSPEFARIAPMAIFAGLTSLQGMAGHQTAYWLYAAKTLLGVWLIRLMWPNVLEMRWKLTWEAVLVGVVIFAAWVGLDGHYPRLSKVDDASGWNPLKTFAGQPGLGWFFCLFRIAGSSIVVPPIEEVFYRSFLYRYLVKVDFNAMPLSRFHLLSFLGTSTIFGLMHPDRWVAGIVCGLGYQWLVIRKGRLGDSMVAHGITNCLLGCYVVWKGAWSFW